MRWLVEIFDIIADERFLADLLTRLDVELYREVNQAYLTSHQFDSLPASSESLLVCGFSKKVLTFDSLLLIFQIGMASFTKASTTSRQREHSINSKKYRGDRTL